MMQCKCVLSVAIYSSSVAHRGRAAGSLARDKSRRAGAAETGRAAGGLPLHCMRENNRGALARRAVHAGAAANPAGPGLGPAAAAAARHGTEPQRYGGLAILRIHQVTRRTDGRTASSIGSHAHRDMHVGLACARSRRLVAVPVLSPQRPARMRGRRMVRVYDDALPSEEGQGLPISIPALLPCSPNSGQRLAFLLAAALPAAFFQRLLRWPPALPISFSFRGHVPVGNAMAWACPCPCPCLHAVIINC
jgi:hypothetical protein